MKRPSTIIKTITLLGALPIIPLAGQAQDTNSTPAAAALPPPTPSNFQPFRIGIEAGTTGAGGQVNWRFANHFGVGAAFDYLDYSYHGTIEGNQYDARLRLMSEPLTLDLYPSRNSSFHLSLGLLLNENHLSGNASTANGGTISIGGNNYTGMANLDIKQQLADPYVSIGGNLYFDHAHHWSLGGELGAFYTGDPRVNFTATTMPAVAPSDLQQEHDKIVHYARFAQVWPVLKLSLNYSF